MNYLVHIFMSYQNNNSLHGFAFDAQLIQIKSRIIRKTKQKWRRASTLLSIKFAQIPQTSSIIFLYVQIRVRGRKRIPGPLLHAENCKICTYAAIHKISLKEKYIPIVALRMGRPTNSLAEKQSHGQRRYALSPSHQSD